jgi:hypothetical protein
MNRFQSSAPHSSSLFWARTKRERKSGTYKPDPISLAEIYALMDEEWPKLNADRTAEEPKSDTIKQALNTIAGWAKHYVEEQGQRNEQIRSESR